MFKNLEAEMVRRGVEKKDIASLLSVGYNTCIARFNGKPAFSVLEATKIRDKWFEDMELGYLFKIYEESKVK